MATPRFRNLIATKSQWETKNPILKSGEIGCEVVYDINGKITQSQTKRGDGISTWTELPYEDLDVYSHNELATVNLGDISIDDDLQGRLVIDILKDIVSPYQVPSITGFTADNKTNYIYEVGTDLSASYNLAWTISNIENVQDATTGIIASSDVNAFTNLGNVNLQDLSYVLNSAASYTFATPQNINITLTGYDNKNNQINTSEIDIDWVGKIRYGVNGTGQITTSTHVNALSNSVLSNSLERVYSFPVGYPFILIPDFIDVTGIKFIDNDNQLEFSMDLQSVWNSSLPSTIVYNNGNINITYKIYRGEFYYNAPTFIKIDF